MRKPLIQRYAWVLLITVALGGCSEDRSWNAKDVSGLMPDLAFELTRASDGRKVTAGDYAGKVRVVYFGYTSCPDACPAMMGKLSQVLSAMPQSSADQVRVLFVSVDPERDTRERLARYMNGFGERFVGLRGKEATLRELTKRYRVTFGYSEPDESGFYKVSHSNAAFIFDEQGQLHLLARPRLSIEDFAQDLTRLAR